MQLPALGCEIFGTVIVLMSLTVYGLAAEILHPNAQKLWRDTQGGRYVPPTSRTAPSKSPCGAHRPREDVRSARGGSGHGGQAHLLAGPMTSLCPNPPTWC